MNSVLQVILRLDILVDKLAARVLVLQLWVWIRIVVFRQGLAIDFDGDLQAQALDDGHIVDNLPSLRGGVLVQQTQKEKMPMLQFVVEAG